MEFTKMQGIGNDFVFINCLDGKSPADPEDMARRLLRRRFSIGGDGLVLLEPAQDGDAVMRIFNPDGSEAGMCGNALRCTGAYLRIKGYVNDKALIQTGAGPRAVSIREDAGAIMVTANMGRPDFDPARIPVSGESNRINLELCGREVEFFCVSTGVPHAVTYDLFPEHDEFCRAGAYMERYSAFPERSNIEFARAVARNRVEVKVWERGAGETLACGTGACATLVTGASLGLINRKATICLPGGELEIEWSEEDMLRMTGPAELVFEGRI